MSFDFEFSYLIYKCRCDINFYSEISKFCLNIWVKPDVDPHDMHILDGIVKYVFTLLKHASQRTTNVFPKILDRHAEFRTTVFYKYKISHCYIEYGCTWGDKWIPVIKPSKF